MRYQGIAVGLRAGGYMPHDLGEQETIGRRSGEKGIQGGRDPALQSAAAKGEWNGVHRHLGDRSLAHRHRQRSSGKGDEP